MQLDPLPKEGGGIDQVVMGKLGCNLRLPPGGHDTTPFSPSTQGCGNDAPPLLSTAYLPPTAVLLAPS